MELSKFKEIKVGTKLITTCQFIANEVLVVTHVDWDLNPCVVAISEENAENYEVKLSAVDLARSLEIYKERFFIFSAYIETRYEGVYVCGEIKTVGIAPEFASQKCIKEMVLEKNPDAITIVILSVAELTEKDFKDYLSE